MSDEIKKDFWNSEGVQAHLTITQSVIQRMGANSASCKAWCVALVSAILVVVIDKAPQNLSLIALLPTALFLFLDAYYLMLEKSFIASYNSFIDKLHKRQIVASDLYAITPQGNQLKLFWNAVRSFSVWPFYLTLVIVIVLAQGLVLGRT